MELTEKQQEIMSALEQQGYVVYNCYTSVHGHQTLVMVRKEQSTMDIKRIRPDGTFA